MNLPKIYGLIGYPVKHSYSAFMHNAAFKAFGINAEYRLFEIKPEELEKLFLTDSALVDVNGELALKADLVGLNVTIPHKEAVLKYLSWRSSETKFTEAANVVIFKNKNYIEGWNTDGLGFHKHLAKDLKISFVNKKVAILGAGGAAKAVVDQLAKKGVKSIAIYDVEKSRSVKITDKIIKEYPAVESFAVDSIAELNIAGVDLLINCTPVGMKAEDPCLVSPEMIHRGLFVYDLIYNPAQTKLLKLAKEKGAQVSNGLGMLLYQGVRTFEIFEPDFIKENEISINDIVEVMRSALTEAIGK